MKKIIIEFNGTPETARNIALALGWYDCTITVATHKILHVTDFNFKDGPSIIQKLQSVQNIKTTTE